jgi:hypothetical protein
METDPGNRLIPVVLHVLQVVWETGRERRWKRRERRRSGAGASEGNPIGANGISGSIPSIDCMAGGFHWRQLKPFAPHGAITAPEVLPRPPMARSPAARRPRKRLYAGVFDLWIRRSVRPTTWIHAPSSLEPRARPALRRGGPRDQRPPAYGANNPALLERDTRGLLGVLGAYEQSRPAPAAAHPELAGRITRIGKAIDLPHLRADPGRLLSAVARFGPTTPTWGEHSTLRSIRPTRATLQS